MLGLPRLEILLARAQDLLGLPETAPALVELALAPIEGRVAVVQALLDARDLRPPGAHLGLGLGLYPQGGLLGLELRLAPLGLGLALGVLNDRTRVSPGFGLTASYP